jgi:hypothetical protein
VDVGSVADVSVRVKLGKAVIFCVCISLCFERIMGGGLGSGGTPVVIRCYSVI